jgi:hypothetical protein
MKNYVKHIQSEIEPGKAAVEAGIRVSGEVDLLVEELEEVIAPGMSVKR